METDRQREREKGRETERERKQRTVGVKHGKATNPPVPATSAGQQP